ncbi:Rmf/CrpP family protein [Streptomyces sp. NPDC097704]|uniref:ribosome modulation factor n=1 Tax=Streptomyces sp. NPDC097704 TaxID=3157101 RepID=UPI003324E93B
MGFREDALRARQAGLAAARAGHPPTACPRFKDPRLTVAWVRGYRVIRPPEQGHTKEGPAPSRVPALRLFLRGCCGGIGPSQSTKSQVLIHSANEVVNRLRPHIKIVEH